MKFATILIAIMLTACSNYAPTDEEVQNVMVKFNCKPTNEFVGQAAERLYECDNGIKYKYITIYYWAVAEKRKSK